MLNDFSAVGDKWFERVLPSSKLLLSFLCLFAVCGNGNLTGTPANPASGALLASQTPRWCTPFDVPNEYRPTPEVTYPKQHFARMWYDLMMASERFLDVTQGEDDPYSWTNGAGCGYDLGGERYAFTDAVEQDILSNSSRLVYNIDEGTTLGPMDPHLLLGGVTPTHDLYSYDVGLSCWTSFTVQTLL